MKDAGTAAARLSLALVRPLSSEVCTRLSRGFLLLLCAAACDHTGPFVPEDPTLTAPFEAGNPARLTFATVVSAPAWHPAGDTVLYSWRIVERQHADQCIAFLPAAGGTIRRQYCPRSGTGADTMRVYDLPALGLDGRLAFLRLRKPLGLGSGDNGLYVDEGATEPRRLFPLPGSVNGVLYQDADMLRWWGSSALVTLGLADEIRECVTPTGESCDQLVRHPRDLLRLDIAGSVSVVPGTHLATSSAPGATGDELFLTFAGDSRLFRINPGSGTSTVVHDFGPGQIARDAHYSSGRIVVVVGGKVRTLSDDNGPLQVGDGGGFLWVVNAGDGTAQPLSGAGRFFRRPVLNGDATAVVAEGAPFVVVLIAPGSLDSVLTEPPSLFRFGVP